MAKRFIYIRLLKESFVFAFGSVIVNKLRTFLTLLGITIGIFAIISVFTALDWMETGIRENIASLGEDVIYVDKFPWSFDPNLAWWDIIKWPSPSIQEYEEIIKLSQKASHASFVIYATRTMKYKGNAIENVTIVSATHEYVDIRNFEMDKGRYFSSYESKNGRNVVILGNDIASQLFGKLDPLGKEVVSAGFKMTVVGVIKKEGAGGLGDSGMDKAVLVPINFVRNFFNIRQESLRPNIMVKASPGVSATELEDDLRRIMRSIRRLKPTAPDNFSLNRASMITQGFESVFAGINLGGWIIGGFSILVGGFGIANIMFVSVKERTHIIGIQKALGAKNNFILLQFLYESVLLSLTGGVIGLVLVFGGTLVLAELTEYAIKLTPGNILLGLFVSAVIGIISGFAPAYAAARLNPVEAISQSF